jgi:hypothetical protein
VRSGAEEGGSLVWQVLKEHAKQFESKRCVLEKIGPPSRHPAASISSAARPWPFLARRVPKRAPPSYGRYVLEKIAQKDKELDLAPARIGGRRWASCRRRKALLDGHRTALHPSAAAPSSTALLAGQISSFALDSGTTNELDLHLLRAVLRGGHNEQAPHGPPCEYGRPHPDHLHITAGPQAGGPPQARRAVEPCARPSRPFPTQAIASPMTCTLRICRQGWTLCSSCWASGRA